MKALAVEKVEPDAPIGLDETKRQPGEKTCDYLARFSGMLAEASMTALLRGDEVHAIFFATKAAEALQLAKALGFDAAAKLETRS